MAGPVRANACAISTSALCFPRLVLFLIDSNFRVINSVVYAIGGLHAQMAVLCSDLRVGPYRKRNLCTVIWHRQLHTAIPREGAKEQRSNGDGICCKECRSSSSGGRSCPTTCGGRQEKSSCGCKIRRQALRGCGRSSRKSGEGLRACTRAGIQLLSCTQAIIRSKFSKPFRGCYDPRRNVAAGTCRGSTAVDRGAVRTGRGRLRRPG